jgi:formylglycine-generating enzyme required for sulfatase activity
VTVGGVAATSIVVVSSTAITALSPAHSVGAVDIVVVTPNGTATLVGAFTYNAWYTILEQAPNATVVLDATVRANIVASGHPWHIRDNSSGIEMLLIPGGTFNMGEEGSATSLVHTVTLTKAFYLGKTEVTQAQWQAKMGSNPSYFSGNANNPVEQVSWDDIVGFNTVTRLRLPSEAEWEYACRGGTLTSFHSMPGYPNGTNDDSLLGNIAWFGSNNSPYGTKPVAGKAANAFGLYDMSGNVVEWCNDWYVDYSASNETDPAGPSSGLYRVLRGGNWNVNYSSDCRSSYRELTFPFYRGYSVGFRVARTP